MGQPIIIPTETAIISYVPWYLDGRRLLPNSPESPKSSIQEVNVEGSGWMSLDDARALAKGRGYHNLAIPMVAECLVSYQVGEKGFGGTMSISPAEYAFMEKQYLARQQEMELKLNDQPLAARGTGLPSPTDDQPFDNLKREAKERALQKGQSYSARHKPNTHVHSL